MSVFKTKIRGEAAYYIPYHIKGQRHRKYFKKEEYKKAVQWDKRHNKALMAGNSGLMLLSDVQANDVLHAISILPKGRTLSEAVQRAWGNATEESLREYIAKFLAMKEATGITQKHHSIISSRLNKLLENFENFGNITLQSIYDFLSTKGASRKTLGEWFNTYNDFFNYCVRLDAIKSNPLAKWTIDDFGRKKIKKTIEFIAVDVAPKFLNYISSQHPEYLKYYVLSMFSGIRVAEVLRMSENLFDYEKKHIFLPAEITKEKKAEHLADFEPNLWAWLEVCKGMDIKAPSSNTRARIFKKFGLTQNFARHSFATYHYSLYQDSKRTAALTHHTEEVLKNNYMGALVSVDEAREYFNITPDALVRWAEKLKKEDYEAIAGNEIAQKDFSKRIKGLRSDK